ncbi:PH_domain-containing protein [Hexamita inflata]|uniref:PH_domain-containing protein n=1 Tax=Hexamita inflata TaxID=28002 RepID=A0ABP1GRY4_9EUKA
MFPAELHPFQKFKSRQLSSDEILPYQPKVKLLRQIGTAPLHQELIINKAEDGFMYSTFNNQQISFSKDSCELIAQSEQIDNYQVTKTGIMKKCGGSIQTWYWRYFDLKKSSLSYYKSKSDMFPIKTIKLIDVQIVRNEQKLFSMTTSDNQRVWQFETKTKQESEEWIEALQQASFRSK